MNLREESLQELHNDLYFLKMGELKKLCLLYELQPCSTKEAIIAQLYAFLGSGLKMESQPLPDQSRAKKGEFPSLARDSLMLKGAYKNDARTLAFFKELIGRHFHFTAYGIDWLNDRWKKGNPPTYADFARMWQEEYEKRKASPAPLKKEWALLTFLKNYKESRPMATKTEAILAWHVEREAAVKRIMAKLNLENVS